MRSKLIIVATFFLLVIVTLVLTGNLKHVPYQEPVAEEPVSSVEQKPLLFTSTFDIPAENEDECSTDDAVHLSEALPSFLTVDYGRDIDKIYICNGLLNEDEVATLVELDPEEQTDLLNAYSTPNAYVQPNIMCQTSVPDPFIINIVANDKVTAVYAPVNACGFPLEEAVTAYAYAVKS